MFVNSIIRIMTVGYVWNKELKPLLAKTVFPKDGSTSMIVDSFEYDHCIKYGQKLGQITGI